MKIYNVISTVHIVPCKSREQTFENSLFYDCRFNVKVHVAFAPTDCTTNTQFR